MGNIVDLSEHQPSNKIDYTTFFKNVDLLIARVQYGSQHPDKEYNNHIAQAKRYNIHYNTYTFPCFVSVADARVEARDCYSRMDKGSNILWLDIESEYDFNGNPIGITKLSQSVRLEGIKAYVDELRKLGVQKIGAYIAHNVYTAWAINTIVGIFDCIWIPRYGSNNGIPQVKPDFPCDMWQYSSVGRIAGYNGNLDVSLLNGNKPLEYFIGNTQSSPTTNQPAVKFLMVVRAIGEGDIRDAPSHSAGFIRNTKDGELFNVIEIQNDWHKVALSDTQVGWIDGNNGQNLFWVDNPNLKNQPAQSQIYTVKYGDILSKIASANGTTISKLCVLNGISDPDKIYVGQKIKLN